jgi:hypothetical protein
VNPLEFLTVTANNLKNETNESDIRTSMSRSYYALYLEIRDKLVKIGNIPCPKDHGLISDVFFCSGIPADTKEIGINLSTLREYRRQADYEMGKFFDSKNSNLSVYLATETLKKFQSFMKKQNEVSDIINNLVNLSRTLNK